jgi:hypothetical protein
MNKSKTDLASFVFFNFDQATIDLFASKAPTISAFQSFETFLLLSALGRHPQALVTLCSAIESASAASTGRKITDSSDGGLARAWEVLNEVIPRDFHLPTNPTRKQLREKRNDVTHFGFSNKDDHDCAFYSLGLGVPLFAGWAMGQYGINLYESCGNFGRLLKTTVDVIHDSKTNRISALDASSILRRWITFHLRESFMADWEIEVLDADRSTFGTSPVSGIEIREQQLKNLQDTEPHALIDCPICDEFDSMFIALSEKALFEDKKLLPDFGQCKHCDVIFPPKLSPILRELCKPSLTAELTISTCKGYGVGVD